MDDYWYTMEFFETLEDAERWARTHRPEFVIGVYSLRKRGTVREFKDWLATAVDKGWFSAEYAQRFEACVMWNR